MKKALTILFFLMYSLSTQEAGYKSLAIAEGTVLRPYDALFEAICQVESSGNPLAVGDKHLKRHSYGIVQIRQTRLDDYNKRTSANYSVVDLFDVEVSRRIFFFYCHGDLETVAKRWNGSGPATEVYWQRVSALLQN